MENQQSAAAVEALAFTFDTGYSVEAGRLMPGAEMGLRDAGRVAVRYSTSSIHLH